MNKQEMEKHIPPGPYCYRYAGGKGRCPWWALNKDQPHQQNGYCEYLGWGDWQQEVLTLLWDQVKECGINDDEDEDDV
jgi:hypothetical protein